MVSPLWVSVICAALLPQAARGSCNADEDVSLLQLQVAMKPAANGSGDLPLPWRSKKVEEEHEKIKAVQAEQLKELLPEEESNGPPNNAIQPEDVQGGGIMLESIAKVNTSDQSAARAEDGEFPEAGGIAESLGGANGGSIEASTDLSASATEPSLPLEAFLPNAGPNASLPGRFDEGPDMVDLYMKVKYKGGTSSTLGDCSTFECNEEFCLPMVSVLSRHGFNARIALFKEDTLVRQSEGWYPYGKPFPYTPSLWPRSMETEFTDMSTEDGEYSQCVEDYVTHKGLKPGALPEREELLSMQKKGIVPAARRCIRLRTRKMGSSEEWPQGEACASCVCSDFAEFPKQLQYIPF